MEKCQLKSGFYIPKLGLGTWQLRGKEAEKTIKKALELGYRHVDTADYYNNQKGIGKAIKGFDRKELYITSKVWRTNLHYEDVIGVCDTALEQLDTSYLDLFLIHWPNKSIPIEETLDAMQRLVEEDKTKSIGVSNFDAELLEEAVEKSDIPLDVDQIEFNPYLRRKRVLEFCRENDVVLTAYCPLARGRVLGDETLKSIGQRYGKTAAQVSLRWIIQKEAVAIPKASSEKHLKQNLEVFDFELSPEDMEKIDSIEKEEKITSPF